MNNPDTAWFYKARYSLLALGTLLTLTSCAPLANQAGYERIRTVHVLDEPRHRTVHRDGDIRLLDVQINPGDSSLPHTHDFAILYTYLNLGNEPLYGRMGGNTDYVTEPLTHTVPNNGDQLFRIIAMGNPGPAVPDSVRDQPSGMPAAPTVENPWYRSYRLEVAPGATTALQTHINPSVVVQVTDGIARVTREDGITAELAEIGHWEWRVAGSSYQIHNPGNAPVTVVVNEARRQ